MQSIAQQNGGAVADKRKFRRNIRKKVALVKLVNQGAFGCIYRPGFRCNGRPDTSENFVSKIQKKSDTSDNELAIGKTLSAIPNYHLHFAPVVQTCPIDIANIQGKQVESCNVIQKYRGKPNAEFMLNKIRYAGADTLETYVQSQLSTAHFLSKFFELHAYLLIGIDLLTDSHIVHYDLKENNIMYNSTEHIPIIIDFGLSVDMSALINAKTNTDALYRRAFYVYYENYPPWCLEIVLCSYIVQRKNDVKWLTEKADANKLLHVVDTYFQTNNGMKLVTELAPAKASTAKANWQQYIKELCVRKTEKQVVDTLIQSWRSWDNFGMSVIFLSIWNQYKMSKFLAPNNTEYSDMLIYTLLSLPADRHTALQSTQQLPGVVNRLSTLNKK